MDNNALMLEHFVSDEDKASAEVVAKTAKEKAEAARMILEALRILKGNKDFITFYAHVISPELLVLKKKVRNERDMVSIYRAQGALQFVENFLDLDERMKYYNTELKRNVDRSKA